MIYAVAERSSNFQNKLDSVLRFRGRLFRERQVARDCLSRTVNGRFGHRANGRRRRRGGFKFEVRSKGVVRGD